MHGSPKMRWQKAKQCIVRSRWYTKSARVRIVIEAQKKSGKVLQVGSQRVSSIGFAKAKELFAAGEIGKLNMVNAVYDRQSSIGAWEYTIPKDANADTTDWDNLSK